MTDLRDQLADPIVLPRTGLGILLRQLRHAAGMTLDQVGARAHLTRKGVSMRELYGVALPTEALVEHAAALGYRVVLEPLPPAPGEKEIGRRTPGDTDVWFRPTGTGWPDAGALTPDRRSAS